MPRRILLIIALALLPTPAAAFWPYGPGCGPVYVVPYYYAPPVVPLYYYPPARVCPPMAAPDKPAASQGPRVFTEEKPVRPAGYAEPTVAPPEPPVQPEPDAIPKTNLPAAPPMPKLELDLPKLPPASPTPAAEPKSGDLKLPELPPLPSVSKYRPDADGDAVSVQLIPSAGRATAGRPPTAAFWNYTARRLTLTVDGREYQLPARHSVAVAVGGSFTWSMSGGPARTDRLTADAGGVEVVLR